MIFKPRYPLEVKFPHMEFMRIDEGSNITMKLWKTKPVQKCYRVKHEFQNRLKSPAQPIDDAGCTMMQCLHIFGDNQDYSFGSQCQTKCNRGIFKINC